MDKLNKYLLVLKKYQLWAICCIVSLTALICYLAASSGLATKTSDRTKQLAGKFNAVKIGVNHPNQAIIEAVQKRHETLKRGVYEAWEVLYREQKKNNPLPAVLDKDFKEHFENLKPKGELPPLYREQYQNFIKKELPTLLTLVDARRPREGDGQPAGGAAGKGGPSGARTPQSRGMAARGGDAAEEDDWIGIVDWTDFSTLENGFDWQTTPSTLEVVLAQEDLWVIQALLRVIHRTNDGATSNATAAVKRIDALQFGQQAANAWKHAVAALSSEGGEGGRSGGGTDRGGGGATSGRGDSPSEEGGSSVNQQLIEGRYINDNGEPVPFADDAPHYAAHPYEEFMMMPIRMVLLMDQRKVPKLLVECANSRMPIEVRQVHLTKTSGGGLDFGGGQGGAKGGGRGGDTGKGGRGFAAPARATPRVAPGAEQTEGSPYDVPVEILGAIYIYNPPVTGAASAEPAAEEATPAAPAPAAATGDNP